jgi:hypothetical protein
MPTDLMNAPAIPYQYTKKFANAQGLASGALATLVIPPQGRFYKLVFRFLTAAGAEVTQAQLEAEVTDFRLRINGDLLYDVKTAELNMLQNYYGSGFGAGVVAGVMVVNLDRSNLNLPGERSQYAIGTMGVNSIECQFVCATLTNVASIECYASLTAEVAPVGSHQRILSFPQTFATTGDHEVSTLPTTPGTAYLNLHIALGSGTLLKTTAIADNTDLFQETPASVLRVLANDSGRTPQTGYRHLPFDKENELLGFLPMAKGDGTSVKDLRIRNNWSVAPGNHRFIAERVWDLKN